MPPPKIQAPFRKRLDSTGKSALRVLLKGNEILEIDPKGGPALLNWAADVLSDQRAKSLSKRLGEGTTKNRADMKTMIPFSVERRMAGSAVPNSQAESAPRVDEAIASKDDPNALDIDQMHAVRMASIREIDEIINRLGKSSDILEKSIQRIQASRDVHFPTNLADIEFPELDFEEDEQGCAKNKFDEEHEGHTYLCKGDIWREARPDSPYTTIDGKTKRQNAQCKRCTNNLEGQVWVCDLCNAGQRDIVICDDCRKEYESERAAQGGKEAAENKFSKWVEKVHLDYQLMLLDGATY